MLRRLYFNFVDHFLHVRNLLGQFIGLNLLLRSLYGAFENQSAALCGKMDALLVECRMGLNGGFEVILNGAIKA